MTVKVLAVNQKAAIAEICRHFNISKEVLGVAVGVSRRTVERVCQEAAEAKAKTVPEFSALAALQKLMYKHKLTIPEMETLLEQTPKTILKYMSEDRTTRKSPKGHVGKQSELILVPQVAFTLSPKNQALKERLTQK